jgi:hypothetical protein
MPEVALKAGPMPCKNCEAMIPPQPSGPGRPKVFCSRECRRGYFHRQEKAELERERAEEWERSKQEHDIRWYGKREAKRLAKERARNRERRA